MMAPVLQSSPPWAGSGIDVGPSGLGSVSGGGSGGRQWGSRSDIEVILA